MAKQIRVLIADDSALMRRELKRLIETDSDLAVVGAARNGEEAVELAKELKPDVITLDINMPVMDGLTALQFIMAEQPRPVIMVSSLTQDGAVTSYEAIELGAVDFVGKPGGTVSANLSEVARDLTAKIKSASVANLTAAGAARKRRRQQTQARTRAQSSPSSASSLSYSSSASAPASKSSKSSDSSKLSYRMNGKKLVLIGQSTGGPNTIMEVLPFIPKNFHLPIVIVQHMPGSFTPSFAQRLSKNCAIPFAEVKAGDELLPGHGYLAPGDIHTILISDTKPSGRVFFRTTKFPADTLHKPSVDVTFDSALNCFSAESLIGVILTGMGADGAQTMARIRKGGGCTIAESEETAIVFGMPKEAIRMGGAEFVLPAHEIGQKIVELAEVTSSVSQKEVF